MGYEMTMRLMIIVGIALLNAGCATGLVPVISTYNPSADARVLVDNGTGFISLFPNQTCKEVDVRHQILGRDALPSTDGAYASSFTDVNYYFVSNIDIGMPKPPLFKSNGRLHYSELVVKAGQPLTVMGRNANIENDQCGPVFTTLVPKPGRDYEVFMKVSALSPRSCELFLREITVGQAGVVIIRPEEPAHGEFQCHSPKIGGWPYADFTRQEVGR